MGAKQEFVKVIKVDERYIRLNTLTPYRNPKLNEFLDMRSCLNHFAIGYVRNFFMIISDIVFKYQDFDDETEVIFQREDQMNYVKGPKRKFLKTANYLMRQNI